MTTSSVPFCPTSLLTHVETIVGPLNMKYRYELFEHAVADVCVWDNLLAMFE
jgi:hypothetical protein